MVGTLRQLLDVQVPVLSELSHSLRRVREEYGFEAQQPLAPGDGALVVAYREAREEVDRHAFTVTPRLRDLYAEKNHACGGVPSVEFDVDDLLGATPISSTTSRSCCPPGDSNGDEFVFPPSFD